MYLLTFGDSSDGIVSPKLQNNHNARRVAGWERKLRLVMVIVFKTKTKSDPVCISFADISINYLSVLVTLSNPIRAG